MATHHILIVAVQKVPNLAAPQAGVEHTIVYYRLDGDANSTYSIVIGGYPVTLKQAVDAISKDVKQRDELIGQVAQID